MPAFHASLGRPFHRRTIMLDPNGGFKIVNPDFHSNLDGLKGIHIDHPDNP